MKTLLINTTDRGGAAQSCIRLHKGLLQLSIDSKLLLKEKTNENISDTYKISLQTIARSLYTKLSHRLKNILKELDLYTEKTDKFIKLRPGGLEMFSYPYSDYRIEKSELYKEADIINLHWVANFLDYKSFFANNTKPVVWTLHDQNPFTGGEHYKETILGIDSKGYPIKRTLSNFEKQKFKDILKYKAEALSKVNNLTIVAPSLWLCNEAKNSELFSNFTVKHIPNGLESDIFKPVDNLYSKHLLNLPLDKKILLFVSDYVVNQRKGFIYLQAAIENLKNDKIFLISVGTKNNDLKNLPNYKHFGFIHENLLMSVIYSAADAFVIPSLMDNLPNTVLESIMCGTPVIGFPTGGIPDMIQDGDNGFIANEISVDALVKAISKFIECDDIFDADIIRKNAVDKYDLSVQAKEYLQLYSDILISS